MNPKTSQDLFNKIRSQFSNIQVGDESGVPTADPSSAVFFEFEFKEDADTYGAVSISLADGENMKVFYNRNLVDKIDEDSKDEWYAFLKELKDFAVEHQLAFDVRDITKSNLTKQDYQNLADTNKTVNTDEMSEELNRITKLAGVEEAPIDRGAPADKGRPADPETGLTGGVAPTTIAKQFPGVDDKSSLVRAVTKMKSGESNYTRDEITAAADAFKEILAKDPKETSRLMTMLKGVAQKANPFNHPDDWVGHGMMKNKDANVKGKGRGTDRKGTVWGTESVDELNKITKLAGVAESLTGTARRSYEDLEKTRLIVRHSGKVDEEVPGSRSRHIESLYIENEDGERFKYPLTHLAGARAMQRHVANGGRPHDEFGEHIVKTSEDIAKLNSFSRYVSHKDQLNDNAGDIIEKTKLQLENLREYIRNISKQPHYEAASKDFKTSEEIVLDDETIAKLREKFTMKNLDNRVEDALPLINRIMSELEAPKEDAGDRDAGIDTVIFGLGQGYMSASLWKNSKKQDVEIKANTPQEMANTLMKHGATIKNTHFSHSSSIDFPDEDGGWNNKKYGNDSHGFIDDTLEWMNRLTKKQGGFDGTVRGPDESAVTELDPGDEPIDAPIQPAVDHSMIVKQFLANPNSKILLNKNMPDEKKYDVPNATPEDTRIMTTLSDIASRMLTKTPDEDRVANFASRVADQMEKSGMPFDPKDPDANKNRDIAKALVAKYDKASEEVDPADFKAKKDIKGKPHSSTEAFENWVNDIDEYDKEPTDEKDREEKLKTLQNIQMDPNTPKDHDLVQMLRKRKQELQKKEPAFAGEQVTFEDIKPYVSMYKDDQTGKMTYDVLDKDGASAFKTSDSKVAMAYLSKNFNKLKMDKDERIDQGIAQQKADAETNPNWGKDVGPVDPEKDHREISRIMKYEGINESRTKIVAAIKAKADENAQNIAGVEAELERITQLVNYQ